MELIIGANVLENLTTGMYADSRVIYREFVQNACDSIDQAYKQGVLPEADGNKETISIYIDKAKRYISIEDNGLGIEQAKFAQVLGNIADSEKRIGQARGFRGIGRLAALAYCRKLRFIAKYKGESVASVMDIDAEKMRSRIAENNSKLVKHEALSIWNEIVSFTKLEDCNVERHYFRVELQDVLRESSELLDVDRVEAYLADVAPVPFDKTFYMRSKIQEYAKENRHELSTYRIFLDDPSGATGGVQIVKPYRDNFECGRGNGRDSITDIAFREFTASDGKPLAWLWFGVTGLRGALPDSLRMRCIRIRSGNIQVGANEAFENYFATERRGNKYYIGEVHVLHEELIPNSQRDNFNETPIRKEFESQMKELTRKELSRYFHEGSDINGFIKKMKIRDKEEEEYRKWIEQGKAIDEEDRKKREQKYQKLKEDGEKAEQELRKRASVDTGDKEDVSATIAKRRLKAYESEKETSATTKPPRQDPKNRNRRRVDNLSAMSKKERKLIDRIYRVIREKLDADESEKLIAAVETELKR